MEHGDWMATEAARRGPTWVPHGEHRREKRSRKRQKCSLRSPEFEMLWDTQADTAAQRCTVPESSAQ